MTVETGLCLPRGGLSQKSSTVSSILICCILRHIFSCAPHELSRLFIERRVVHPNP